MPNLVLFTILFMPISEYNIVWCTIRLQPSGPNELTIEKDSDTLRTHSGVLVSIQMAASEHMLHIYQTLVKIPKSKRKVGRSSFKAFPRP